MSVHGTKDYDCGDRVMNAPKHTPTSWRVKELSNGYAIENEREHIGHCSSLHDLRDEANAEHIVRCVNAHDALVEALSAYVDESIDLTDLPCHQGLFRADQCRRCSRELNARAALALARGEV